MPPPALTALAAFPLLQGQVGRTIEYQALRIRERFMGAVDRPAVIKAIDEQLRAHTTGLITIESPSGGGATTVLCHLAMTRPYAFWFPEECGQAGLEALCGQLLALYDLSVPLVPPIATRDALTLERLLVEATERRTDDAPVVILIGHLPDDDLVATPLPFPTTIPPGVVIVLACTSADVLPLMPVARIVLGEVDTSFDEVLVQAALQYEHGEPLAQALAASCQGSLLYLRFAAGLLQTQIVHPHALPGGLHALHLFWWNGLDANERRLAMLLAAAGEPITPTIAAEVADMPIERVSESLRRWHALLAYTDDAVGLHHRSTRAFIAQQSQDNLVAAHTRYVTIAYVRSVGVMERLHPDGDGYFVRQLARHIAHSDRPTRTAISLAQRGWIRARERHTGNLCDAANDAAWELRTAAHDGPTLRLIRTAALAGTLALLARTLPPDAPADAFTAALLGNAPRESVLKRVREIIDQLPDGHDKAQALRRLGEACYAQRMRTPAMRMLSEALDLEVQGLPRVWRDEREATLVALARAAIAIDEPDTALGITARISHAERRGLIETEVVRWLLTHGHLTRAEEVAYAIGHGGMHEWAMAEVAVGHGRADNHTRSAEVLSTLKTATAIAWAHGELASDAAQRAETGVNERIAAITNARLRDRALALVALAQAAGGAPTAAITTARTIEDREVRVRALIDLTLRHPSEDGTALAYAAADIVALPNDDRAPLVAALAAAQAAIGRLDTALNTAALLPEGEEYDRAQSRIAVALARGGHYASARTIAVAITDDDERDWAFDELARLIAHAGNWREALSIAAKISDAEQRAHTEADIAIAWARAGDPPAAHRYAERITLQTERVRAHTAIIEPLIANGGHAQAHTTLESLTTPDAHSRYQAAFVAALAAHGDLPTAQHLATTITRPLDHARGLVAIARAAAPTQPALAHAMLGTALQVLTTSGRTETFLCLEWAADTLAILGQAELLLSAADAIDEVDLWWGT